MIGQTKLLSQIDKMVSVGFPRFTILVGNKGGRTLIAYDICKKLKAQYITVGTKVDEVREIIDMSYKQSEPTLYVIPNADKMSVAAKNALLKITEEPPRKSYFLMILNDLSSTLATLKSRATVLQMNSYTPTELIEYCNLKGYNDLTDEAFNIITNIATTPSTVDTLVAYDPIKFYSFTKLVIDNIGVVNGSNAFKIANSINFKDDKDKYDVILFLQVFCYMCRQQILENPALYSLMCKITVNTISELNITGINKQGVFDIWILKIRNTWRSYNE